MDKETRAGIELTVIVHLVVLIFLLLWGIGAEIKGENSFILDFSKQEQRQEEEKVESFQEEISKKVDDIIARSKAENPIKNVAVSSKLRDDRNSASDVAKLMKEAKRVQGELKKGYKADIEEDAEEETVEYSKEQQEGDKQEYSGPSVLSWTLDGRKASHLPIPAYRCYGSGEVAVAISVDQQGKVVGAKVIDAESSADKCLRDFAVRAARLSKFNRDPSAPTRQAGQIVYAFIAQ